MTIDLFIPCFVDQLYPQTAFNTVKLLELAGVEVHYNKNQTCCSQPAYNAGFWEEAEPVGRKFLNDFKGDSHKVSPSGSCTGYVKNHLINILKKTDEQKAVEELAGNMFELTDFLVNIVKKENFGSQLSGRAVYHDACGALRECGIKEEPRKLLKNVEGLDLIEMEGAEDCCGFGGTFAIKFEPISVSMGEQKIESAMKAGAEYLISTDWSCLMHLDGIIRKRNLPITSMHIADVLISGIDK